MNTIYMFLNFIFYFFITIHILSVLELNIFKYFTFLFNLPTYVLFVPLLIIISLLWTLKSIKKNDRMVFLNSLKFKKSKKESLIRYISLYFFGSYFLVNYFMFPHVRVNTNLVTVLAYRKISGMLIFLYFVFLNGFIKIRRGEK
jgi:hypothetical protein